MKEHTLTREQVRELDRRAMESYGIAGLILMENAGIACAREALDMLKGTEEPRVAVFCGKGNNGGDGFVIARHLWNRGADVRVYLAAATGDVLERGGDAATNLNIILKMGLPVAEIVRTGDVAGAVQDSRDADLLVDALLGTGISGEVRGLVRSLISEINGLNKPVLGVDLPSGLDCDSGEPLGEAVRCVRTVTFACAKRGFSSPAARRCTGKVRVADIGIPGNLLPGGRRCQRT